MSDMTETKKEDFIIETNKEDFLKKLYKEGKVDQRYTSPEEDYMMVEVTKNYLKGKEISEKAALIKKVAEDATRPRPQPLFKRVEKYLIMERLRAIQKSLRKESGRILYKSPSLTEEQYKVLLNFNSQEEISDNELAIEVIEILDKYNEKASFKDYFKFKSYRINNTTLGRLRWYEKLYAYTALVIEYYRTY